MRKKNRILELVDDMWWKIYWPSDPIEELRAWWAQQYHKWWYFFRGGGEYRQAKMDVISTHWPPLWHDSFAFFVYYIYKPYKVIHRSTFHTRKWILDFPNRFNALLILHVNMLKLFITLTVEFLIMTWAYHIDLISSFMTLYIHLLEWISLIV